MPYRDLFKRKEDEKREEERREFGSIEGMTEVIQKTIKKNGVEMQSVVCMEECSELVQAISKELRGRGCKEHLTEEIADVQICIEMLKIMYGIRDCDIDGWKIAKISRLNRRLGEKMV